jgi:AspT/YidE/YbjL antiporter-like protein
MVGILGTLQVFVAQPIAHAILVIACVAVAGLALGSFKYRGIALGSAGVLFAGIVFGHFGERIDHQILDFVKEFGLVLFVFCIGLQLGPGFVAALRQQGLKLNVLATSPMMRPDGLTGRTASLSRDRIASRPSLNTRSPRITQGARHPPTAACSHPRPPPCSGGRWRRRDP